MLFRNFSKRSLKLGKEVHRIDTGGVKTSAGGSTDTYRLHTCRIWAEGLQIRAGSGDHSADHLKLHRRRRLRAFSAAVRTQCLLSASLTARLSALTFLCEGIQVNPASFARSVAPILLCNGRTRAALVV
eukprot:scaffold2405_cov211-Pinguiococcus_pyrenoidosus.AAC.5